MKENNSHNSKIERRIFFALWPAQDIRDALKKNTLPVMKHYLNENTVRKVPIHNWHLTLAFVGNVSAETFSCCFEQASGVSTGAFSLTLNKFDYFEQSKVIWLGGDETPVGWYELVTCLNEVLLVCGYKPDRPHPVPHMTLLRKAKQAVAATQFKTVSWDVNEFALIESTTTEKGVLYSVLKRWPLR